MPTGLYPAASLPYVPLVVEPELVFSPLPELVPPLLVDELLLLFDPLLVPELELPDPLETTIVMVDPAVAEVADYPDDLALCN